MTDLSQATRSSVADLLLSQFEGREVVNIRYRFDIVTAEEVTIQNEITQYTVEDGSSRQEHVTRPPIAITLEGFVAEKVYKYEMAQYASQLGSYLSKLQPISAYLPEVSNYSKLAFMAVNRVETRIRKLVNEAKNIKNLFSPTATASSKRQTQIVDELRQLRDSQTLVTVVSDLGRYDNMMIEQVKARQEETSDQCHLVIDLLQYNPVSTQLTYIDTQKYAQQIAQQAAQVQELGQIQGKSMSMLRSMVSPAVVPYFTGVN